MRIRPLLALLASALLSSFQTVQTELVRLSASPPQGSDFGNSLALAGDTLFVGAQTTPGLTGRPEMGAVHVFRRGPMGWQEVQVLASTGTQDYERMGVTVRVSGDRLAAGTLGHGVRLFRFDGTQWVTEQAIAPPAGTSSQLFGVFVALDGDTLAVSDQFEHGAGSRSGAAYVYVRGSAGWVLQQRIALLDAVAEDYAGYPALQGNTLLIGAPGKYSRQGIVDVYQRSGSTWHRSQRLATPRAQPDDWFGARIALDGDTVLVAAPQEDDVLLAGAFPPARPARSQAGAVHVYARPAGAWIHQAELVDDGRDPSAAFGLACALRGDLAAIGSWALGGGSGNAKALLFQRTGTRWRQVTELDSSDGTPSDAFGFSCVLGAGTVHVGAPNQEAGARDSGAVYEFRLLGEGVTLVPGQGLNPDALRADAAVLGQNWVAEVGVRAAHGPGAAVLVVSTATGPGQPALGGRGEWLLGSRMLLVLGPVFHDGTGTSAPFSFRVPNDLALLGRPWAAQALVGGPRLALTNALTGSVR